MQPDQTNVWPVEASRLHQLLGGRALPERGCAWCALTSRLCMSRQKDSQGPGNELMSHVLPWLVLQRPDSNAPDTRGTDDLDAVWHVSKAARVMALQSAPRALRLRPHAGNLATRALLVTELRELLRGRSHPLGLTLDMALTSNSQLHELLSAAAAAPRLTSQGRQRECCVRYLSLLSAAPGEGAATFWSGIGPAFPAVRVLDMRTTATLPPSLFLGLASCRQLACLALGPNVRASPELAACAPEALRATAPSLRLMLSSGDTAQLPLITAFAPQLVELHVGQPMQGLAAALSHACNLRAVRLHTLDQDALEALITLPQLQSVSAEHLCLSMHAPHPAASQWHKVTVASTVPMRDAYFLATAVHGVRRLWLGSLLIPWSIGDEGADVAGRALNTGPNVVGPAWLMPRQLRACVGLVSNALAAALDPWLRYTLGQELHVSFLPDMPPELLRSACQGLAPLVPRAQRIRLSAHTAQGAEFAGVPLDGQSLMLLADAGAVDVSADITYLYPDLCEELSCDMNLQRLELKMGFSAEDCDDHQYSTLELSNMCAGRMKPLLLELHFKAKPPGMGPQPDPEGIPCDQDVQQGAEAEDALDQVVPVEVVAGGAEAAEGQGPPGEEDYQGTGDQYEFEGGLVTGRMHWNKYGELFWTCDNEGRRDRLMLAELSGDWRQRLAALALNTWVELLADQW